MAGLALTDKERGMNTLTKMALGLMGQLKPQAATGDADTAIQLRPAQTQGGHVLDAGLAAQAIAA
jgi:hypothetical protein